MKVKLFQRLFLPASIIGGLVGLLLGPQLLGLYSPVCVTYTDSIPQWANVLLAVTFACSFLGESMEKITKQAIASTLVSGVVHQAQAILGMVVAFFFSAAIPIGFGLIPLYALWGGIGWSVPVATIFETEGYWADAVPVAITIATIGVVCGIVFGIVLVNIGIRKGLLVHSAASIDDLPEEIRTGYVPIGKREPIGYAVSKNSSADPMTVQLAIVGFVVACALYLRNFLISIDPFWNNLPLLSTSLFCSGVFGFIIGRAPFLQQFIDRPSLERISNVSLEYLITSAVATTSIEAFVTYVVPIAIISIVTIGATTWLTFFFSKRWDLKDWFALRCRTVRRVPRTALDRASSRQGRRPRPQDCGGGDRSRGLYPGLQLRAPIPAHYAYDGYGKPEVGIHHKRGAAHSVPYRRRPAVPQEKGRRGEFLEPSTNYTKKRRPRRAPLFIMKSYSY